MTQVHHRCQDREEVHGEQNRRAGHGTAVLLTGVAVIEADGLQFRRRSTF